MDAPEKIYLVKDYNTDNPMDYWYSATTDDTKVEYVRKDAFIEKAVRWLKKELPITDLSPSNMLEISFKVFDKECKKAFIEKFKKYMEE